ncbi:MAG: ribosome silencing factor [Bacteroidetes bacterium]|nr:ribosome silencing factor [Bacteroidota bacterium]
MAKKKVTKETSEELKATEQITLIEDPLLQFTQIIVNAMQDKKAQDIVSLDLRTLNNRVVDKFIICHAENTRQVYAIAGEVEDQISVMLREKPWHREGFENKEWIILDYVNVIVHVFLKEKREFYAIEELWGDANVEKFANLS